MKTLLLLAVTYCMVLPFIAEGKEALPPRLALVYGADTIGPLYTPVTTPAIGTLN